MFPGFWPFLVRGPRPSTWETPLKMFHSQEPPSNKSDPSKFQTYLFFPAKNSFDTTFTTCHPVPYPSIASSMARIGNLLQGRSISSSSVAFHGVPEKAVDGQWGDNTFCEYCAQNDPLHVCASTRRQEMALLICWGCGDGCWFYLSNVESFRCFRGYGCG